MAFKWKADFGRSFLLFVALLVLDGSLSSTLTRGPQYYEIIRPILPPSRENMEQFSVPGMPPADSSIPAIAPPIPVQPFGPIDEIQGPRKRSAIVIDKLMYALQKALDGKEKTAPRVASFAAAPKFQRRTTGDNRLYWRCYFNAVSCF